MNLQRVTGPAFSCFCYVCNKRIEPQAPKWANLDGEPFKDYRCLDCWREENAQSGIEQSLQT
jgi:hypothetical protein